MIIKNNKNFKNRNKTKTKKLTTSSTLNNSELKSLLRNEEIFNPLLRTFSNFESGLKFQKLLYKTKFLVPLISNKKHIGGKMLYINNEYKTKFYLIFTDFDEINSCFRKEKYQYFETTLDKISKVALKNNALILLNWKSDNFILNQETLQNLFSRESIKTVQPVKTNPLYKDASNIYPQLTNSLLTYMKSVDNLNKSYFLIQNSTNKLLLLLDINKEDLNNISQEIRKIIRKEKLDINITISNRCTPYLKYPVFYQKNDDTNTHELHA